MQVSGRHTALEPGYIPMLATYGLNCDPLEPDSADDAVFSMTWRRLLRLALIATETGYRYQREEIDVDAVAWLQSPREFFGGRAALVACLERVDCMRGMLLHGLALDLDAQPEELDALMADEYLAGKGEDESDRTTGHGRRPQRLWSSFIVSDTPRSMLHAFEATVAPTRAEAKARLRAHHGVLAASAAEIMEGFDRTRPMATELIAPALAETLEQVAQNPASPLALGLSVRVEQRFDA